MKITRLLIGTALAIGLNACSSMGGGGQPAGGPAPTSQLPAPADAWRIRTAEHVDLWFHAYGMITDDTANVPYFQRDYRARMTQVKRQRNVTTELDANAGQLSTRFKASPDLAQGQFVIFHYNSLEDLARGVDLFLRSDGSPGAIGDPASRALAAPLASYFRSVADREWLRLFMRAVQDEQTRFYHSYWAAEQQSRNRVLFAVDQLWAQTYRPKFERFLRNTRQSYGTLLLSLPLNGEGRMVSDAGGNAVAVSFPSTEAAAAEALYVFAHELVGTLAQGAIEDNTTPAQKQSGEVAKLVPVGAVRAGAALLQRVAPEMVAGYMRYYLASSGKTVPTGDPTAAFQGAFSLPAAVVAGITKSIDSILGGI